MWEIVKSIRNDERLRRSFNELAKKTFALDFEDWYQNGFLGKNPKAEFMLCSVGRFRV